MKPHWNPNDSPSDTYILDENLPEQTLTVEDIAARWRFSTDKIRRMFENELGVLRVGHGTLRVGRKYRRRYYSLRIPISVFLRVQDRLRNGGQR